ncbi:DUF3047 domain-containing protein [Hydrogenophaga sp.]|uniref:DUF3047 domain-containing protein n=1 Tax=Hydrogenophaga sp. TaxID=1904254 RepID=UPI0025BC19CD|nr:DUF3047 domain-containing protein [Hydrogenophaga sp.]
MEGLAMVVWMRWAGLLLCAALAACAAPPQQPSAYPGQEDLREPTPPHELSPALRAASQALLVTPQSGHAWEPFALPGKRYIQFEPAESGGRAALLVQAQNSVSILRQRFEPALAAPGMLRFSWKVDALPTGADLHDPQNEDAPVRIVLSFDGDRTRLSSQAHRLSELSRLLTGEELPYATLVYVWSTTDALGAVVPNPRTDRIRKLVVDSGTAGLGQWREHVRDAQADYMRVFGEPPGPLLSVALMTDTDNTQTILQAWYGALRLDAALLP